MMLGHNQPKRKSKYIMLQNTPTKAEIRQQIKFNDRLFLKNQQNAGIKDFFKKIGRGAKKVWNKVKKPFKKVWDFMTDGPGNKLLNMVPVVGPTLSKTLETVDDVIDTGVDIAKDIKDTGTKLKENLTNDDRGILDDIDTNKLKQDYDYVKNTTQQLYNKFKSKMNDKERNQAKQNAGMINMSLLKNLKPMQRGKLKKQLPYTIFIDPLKHTRVKIPAKFIDVDSPKTLDNTGGRLFLKGYSSGISLVEPESGRMSLSGVCSVDNSKNDSGRMSLSGKCSVKKKSDEDSGRMSLSGSKSTTINRSSKEEIYKKLFG